MKDYEPDTEHTVRCISPYMTSKALNIIFIGIQGMYLT